jgi:hypothetical protein
VKHGICVNQVDGERSLKTGPGMGTLIILLAASAALFAQSNGGSPDKPQNHSNVPDARLIVGPSIAATERSWQARDHYTYMERDEDRRRYCRDESTFPAGIVEQSD